MPIHMQAHIFWKMRQWRYINIIYDVAGAKRKWMLVACMGQVWVKYIYIYICKAGRKLLFHREWGTGMGFKCLLWGESG